ncbi:hypothetical protein ACRPHP_19230 [Pantoea allii]|uniref:hypothetical protein n=1 Tax=Pantoea allii TaxID=574096 RepID=UPI003D79A1EB
MLIQLKKNLELSKSTTKRMVTNDLDELEHIKDDMKELMEKPIGFHTMGLPLVVSFILTLLSFAMPQALIWEAVFSFMGWPDYALLGGIILTGLPYCLIMFPSLSLIARGNYTALKVYISLMYFTSAVALLYFGHSLWALMFGENTSTLTFLSSCLGVIFMLIAFKCINSLMFYKSNAFYLHNRIWRKQLEIQRKSTSNLKK